MSRFRGGRLRCPKVNRVRTAPTSHPIPRSSVSTCSTCTQRLSRSRTGGIATPWRRRCSGEHHLTDDARLLGVTQGSRQRGPLAAVFQARLQFAQYGGSWPMTALCRQPIIRKRTNFG
jgi:hypothetical protein